MNKDDPNYIDYSIGFLEGAIEGITLYAIWKNGEQLVGCLQRPLSEVLQPIRDELNKLKAEKSTTTKTKPVQNI